MKKLLITLTATLLCAGAFGQGKLSFDIDENHLIYFSADMSKLALADWCITVDNGFGCGALPIEGSSLYTGLTLNGTPGTIMSVSGSATMIAALYGGWSPSSLSLLTTTTIADISNPGGVVPVNCTFSALPAGTPAFFQVLVYDSATGPWRGGYGGGTQIFQATPSASAYMPIYLAGPPVNSTWAPGTHYLTDLSPGCIGPGYYGAIEVWGSLGGIIPRPPYISTQPESITNHWGESATFTVAASGMLPPSYQWQANGTNLSDGPHISGSATHQLILREVTFADAGSYQVTVFNCCGSVISSNAILTVLEGLSITEQPMSQVGYWGKSVNFNVTASGSPLPSYQWQKDGAAIDGATHRSLVLTNLQTTNAGRYTVVVTNSSGSLTSSNAYLSVNPPGVSLVTYPGLTIDAVAGFTYGIQYDTGLANSTGWQGMTNLSLDVPTALWFDAQPATQHQRFYRVVPGPIPIP